MEQGGLGAEPVFPVGEDPHGALAEEGGQMREAETVVVQAMHRRLLRKAGHKVRCVLTEGGSHFVTPMALAAQGGPAAGSAAAPGTAAAAGRCC